MYSSSKLFSYSKASSTPMSISEKWLSDEKRILENNCKFDVQYLGSTEISKPDDFETCCTVLKDLIGKKKLIKGILMISSFSFILSEKPTMDIKVDQTLKDIIFCSSHPLIPYAFLYTTRDPILNKFQLWGFISMKEVALFYEKIRILFKKLLQGENFNMFFKSERIIGAMLIALKFYSEKQSESTNYLSNYQKSQQIEQDKAFKQNSLVERFQDPQSSIVISSPKISCSKTFTDLKSIPRPKPGKKNSYDLFSSLNQNDFFKNADYDIAKSVNSTSEFSQKADFANAFIPNFENNLSCQNYSFNKSMPDTRLFNFENDTLQTSKYDIFKNAETPFASTGWSENIIGVDKSKQQTNKIPPTNQSSLEFDNFISTFIENSDLKKRPN